MTQYDGMQMSCQCFAKMLIHYRFGKFLALRIGPILGKVLLKICLTSMVLIL
jgi:hypothetical protein